jgi:hypothetical protein
MEEANSSTTEVARVAIRLPSFWAERPASWFTQAEAQFHLAGINNELTKFSCCITVRGKICCRSGWHNPPPQQNPYTALKTEKRLCPSKDLRTRQLFTLELGDRKPSQFLRHLKSLAPDTPDDYLRILWTSRLPTDIRTILAGLPEVELESAALWADRIMDTISPTTVATTTLSTDNTDLLQSIWDLPRQVANLLSEQNLTNSNKGRVNFKDRRSRSRSRRSNSSTRNTRRSPSRQTTNTTTNTLCWYHQNFGDRAQRCSQPCTFKTQNSTLSFSTDN